MVEEYVDFEILAATEGGEYLALIGKETLNALTKFDEGLVVRNWDGLKPVILEPYGESAVSTKEDATTLNNLTQLPKIKASELRRFLER